MERTLVNHRVFGYPHNQSKFAANYTYHVDTSRHFCVLWSQFCARDPTPKVKFPDNWLRLSFFHVEVDVLESSARSKSCLLEKTSYLRRFWSDSSKYSGRHWRTSNVICCCQHEIQCPNKEHHRNWPLSTQPPFKLWLVLVFKVHLTTFKTWRIKWRFKININYDIQTTSHDCFRSLKKIIVMKHVVVVNKRIQQNNISSLRL